MIPRIKEVPLTFTRGYRHINKDNIIAERINHVYIARNSDNSTRIEFLSELEPSILPQLYPILLLDNNQAFEQYQTIQDLKPLFEEYNHTEAEMTLEKEQPNALHYTFGYFNANLIIVQQGESVMLFNDTTRYDGFETKSFAVITHSVQDIAKFIHCFNFGGLNCY